MRKECACCFFVKFGSQTIEAKHLLHLVKKPPLSPCMDFSLIMAVSFDLAVALLFLAPAATALISSSVLLG
jgi:hypothetical protein